MEEPEIKTDGDGTPLIILEESYHIDISNTKMGEWTTWVFNPKKGEFEIEDDKNK